MNSKDAKAVDSAFKLFQEKKYDKAGKAFDKLLENEGIPSWIKIKVGQFKTIVDQQLASKGDAEPESVKMVSHLMNLGSYEQAEAILDKLDVSDGDKTFLKAEMLIEQDEVDEAIDLLKDAIKHDSSNLGYALNSPSFSAHLNDEKFHFLRKNQEQSDS